MGPFSSSFNSYVFVLIISVTSILKLSNSTYLSWPLQLDEDFLGLVHHVCICSSLRLAVLAAGQDPTSPSLSEIISAVTACMAIWLNIA